MEINLKDLDAGLGQTVTPVGNPTPIGTYNVYKVGPVALSTNDALKNHVQSTDYDPVSYQYLVFQDGPPAVKGVNGVTIESLLLTCADRLEDFQAHPMVACAENQAALDYIKQAVYALNQRTIRLAHEAELKAQLTS